MSGDGGGKKFDPDRVSFAKAADEKEIYFPQYIQDRLKEDGNSVTFSKSRFLAKLDNDGNATGSAYGEAGSVDDIQGLITIDASGLAAKRVVFRNCHFHHPIKFKSAEFSTLSFIDCSFGPDFEAFKGCDFANIKDSLHEDIRAPLSEGRVAWLDLDDVIARQVILELKSVEDFEQTTLLIHARNGIVTGDVRARLSGKTTTLLMDSTRIFGRLMLDSIWEPPNNTEEHARLFINLNDVDVESTIEVNGPRQGENPYALLALNARDLRCRDELRLNRVALMDLFGITPKPDASVEREWAEGNLGVKQPALDLGRANVAGLRLGLRKLEDLAAGKSNDDKRLLSHVFLGERMPNTPKDVKTDIKDIRVNTIGVFSGPPDAPTSASDFWPEFIDQVTPNDTSQAKGIVARFFGMFSTETPDSSDPESRRQQILVQRRLYSIFARAAERSNHRKIADRLLQGESRMEREWLRLPSNDGEHSVRTRTFWVVAAFGLTIVGVCLAMVAIRYFSRHGLDYSDLTLSDAIPWPLSGRDLFYAGLFGSLVFLMRMTLKRGKGNGLEAFLRGLLAHVVGDGMTPFRAGAWLACLWGTSTFLAWMAMAAGYFAPEEPAIYRGDYELLKIAEIREITRHESDPVAAFYHPLFLAISNSGTAEERELDRHILMSTPLIGFHTACRLNWAEPSWIDREEWTATLLASLPPDMNGYTRPGSPDQRRDFYHSIDPVTACERLLPAEYSQFSPWIYAADVVLPLLDLRLESEWSLRVSQFHSGQNLSMAIIFRVFEVLLTMFGWFFALILAGAITNLGEGRRSRF